MCDTSLLHNALYQHCPELHLKRLNTLILACEGLLAGNSLTLTSLGRNVRSSAYTKHNIKRMDRMLGNHQLHAERISVYRWHASLLCSGNPMPVVLVDWADIREREHLMVLRASVAMKGRSITLFEQTFTLKEHGGPKAHEIFLKALANILPDTVTPIIVSDAGFRVTWYRAVERHGWYWLGRVRGKVSFSELDCRKWRSVKTLHAQACQKPKYIGKVQLAKKHPIACQMHLYQAPAKGRKGQRSATTNVHHPDQKKHIKGAKEPWLLATNLPEEKFKPVQVIRLYGKRMQIEESFRDLKSPLYGLGLRQSRTKCPKRFDILLLVVLLVHFLYWLIGLAAEARGWHRHFQANSIRSRRVLSLVRLGREVMAHERYRLEPQALYETWQEFQHDIIANSGLEAKL